MSLILYILSFLLIWLGAGLIIKAVIRISHVLRISSFFLSFFVLGLLTSTPEFFVGINSIIDRDPEIFVGNLIGGIVLLFLLVIPLLAILGNGVTLEHQLSNKNILFALLVITAPAFMITDKKVSVYEALFLIISYIMLFYTINKSRGLLEKVKDHFNHKQPHIIHDVFRITIGVVIVFAASKIIVDKTIYFSHIIGISPFIISLLLLSLGTNLPELSLIIRSLVLKKKEVALGDYIGSAAANSLLVGIFTLLNGGEVLIVNHFFKPFIFTLLGLGLFFFFTRSKNDISRNEGIIMLIVYILFVIVELIP